MDLLYVPGSFYVIVIMEQIPTVLLGMELTQALPMKKSENGILENKIELSALQGALGTVSCSYSLPVTNSHPKGASDAHSSRGASSQTRVAKLTLALLFWEESDYCSGTERK